MKRTKLQREALKSDPTHLGRSAFNAGDCMDDNPYSVVMDYEHWRDWNGGFLSRIEQQEVSASAASTVREVLTEMKFKKPKLH